MLNLTTTEMTALTSGLPLLNVTTAGDKISALTKKIEVTLT